MKRYVAPGWVEALKARHLNSFKDIWNLELDWFEEPNYRRGGWSGVSTLDLTGPQGDSVRLFVKRQENHNHKSLRYPLKGIPTYELEFDNIRKYWSFNIPTLVPVYFASEKKDGKQRAILITEALENFISLYQLEVNWISDGAPSVGTRRELVKDVAGLLRKIHKHGIQNNSFYSKHIFVSTDYLENLNVNSGKHSRDKNDKIRIIDLESSRQKWPINQSGLRDMDSLNRHSSHWSNSDRLVFLLAYLGRSKVDAECSRIWDKLKRSYNSKRGR